MISLKVLVPSRGYLYLNRSARCGTAPPLASSRPLSGLSISQSMTRIEEMRSSMSSRPLSGLSISQLERRRRVQIAPGGSRPLSGLSISQ